MRQCVPPRDCPCRVRGVLHATGSGSAGRLHSVQLAHATEPTSRQRVMPGVHDVQLPSSQRFNSLTRSSCSPRRCGCAGHKPLDSAAPGRSVPPTVPTQACDIPVCLTCLCRERNGPTDNTPHMKWHQTACRRWEVGAPCCGTRPLTAPHKLPRNKRPAHGVVLGIGTSACGGSCRARRQTATHARGIGAARQTSLPQARMHVVL
jgi:hypothetical protein